MFNSIIATQACSVNYCLLFLLQVLPGSNCVRSKFYTVAPPCNMSNCKPKGVSNNEANLPQLNNVFLIQRQNNVVVDPN